MDYDHPTGIETKAKMTVIIIVAVIVVAAVGFMGYRQFMEWHETRLQSAVLEQQQKIAEKNADLEYQILELKNKLAMLKPPPVSEDRIKEVFGKPQSDMAEQTADSCTAIKQRITSFFNYLQQNADAGTHQSGNNPSDEFFQMIRALAAHPPLVVDETRDIVSLKHNLAHFYRILKKDRIEMIKNIFTIEDDVLEKVMADFYAYYVTGDCCENDKESCLSLNTLYEYAGFFTNTFAGRSYLFRRKSAIRSLMDYYSVLILDRANEAGINRYGIDIRPQIDLALDNIVNRNNLLFQDQYLKKLIDLQEKYSS